MGIKTGEIPFVDQSYEERRTKLRYEYLHNAELHKAIKLLAFEIKEELQSKVTHVYDMRNLEIIIEFLVDGFLAYEKIWEEGGCRNVKIDPISLEPEIKNGQKIWIQFRNDVNQREIPDRNIVYVMYNALEMSFAQSLYTKLIDYNDIEFIKLHTKQIASKLYRQ